MHATQCTTVQCVQLQHTTVHLFTVQRSSRLLILHGVDKQPPSLMECSGDKETWTLKCPGESTGERLQTLRWRTYWPWGCPQRPCRVDLAVLTSNTKAPVCGGQTGEVVWSWDPVKVRDCRIMAAILGQGASRLSEDDGAEEGTLILQGLRVLQPHPIPAPPDMRHVSLTMLR